MVPDEEASPAAPRCTGAMDLGAGAREGRLGRRRRWGAAPAAGQRHVSATPLLRHWCYATGQDALLPGHVIRTWKSIRRQRGRHPVAVAAAMVRCMPLSSSLVYPEVHGSGVQIWGRNQRLDEAVCRWEGTLLQDPHLLCPSDHEVGIKPLYLGNQCKYPLPPQTLAMLMAGAWHSLSFRVATLSSICLMSKTGAHPGIIGPYNKGNKSYR